MMNQADLSDTKDLQTGVVTVTSFTSNSKNYLPEQLEVKFKFVLNQRGKAYAIVNSSGNCYALEVGGNQLNAIIYSLAYEAGNVLKKYELDELNQYLIAKAIMSGLVFHTYSRVAPTTDGGGIEIDLADEANTRIRIIDGNVQIIRDGSLIPFARNPKAKPMVMPAEYGDVRLLKKYVNCSHQDFVLLTAFIAYSLAHPKVKTSKFMFLVLLGASGAGKSFVAENIIIPLIDNSLVGIQSFPKDEKGLGVATQNSQVACFDNVRNLNVIMSDALCKLSTGNSLTSKKLYTDDDQHIISLHSAVVLNGVNSFVTEPDLAQRCLTIELKTMVNSERLSESEMVPELNAELPIIFRGVLNLIAGVLQKLPEAKVTHPERMLDFVRFLSAMELVDGVPCGVYQELYSSKLKEDQVDSLFDDPLAVAVIDFASNKSNFYKGKWSGMPQKLLSALHDLHKGNRFSGLPTIPSAFSKRLRFISAGLLAQGIRVEFIRAKDRIITIEILGDDNDY